MCSNNLTLQELSDISGVPIETVRNIYYGKVTDPKASTVLAISKALNVTVNYLMGYPTYNPDEIFIIRHYRKCGPHGKNIIQLVAKYESKISRSERDASDKYKIPCLVPIGNKGDGIPYCSNDVVDIETVLPDAYLAIEITTNHFTPVFCKNDRVLFANRFPENGEIAVFMKSDKAYLRKFIEEEDGYCLKSLNGRGFDILLRRMDEVDCIGTCIGIVRA